MFSEQQFNLPQSRRVFLATTASAFLIPALGSNQSNSVLTNAMTVQQVIDAILKAIPINPIQNTVDTLKAGSGNTVVTGIITTMFTTLPVIKKAIELKANFIVAHEPTFYSHTDETPWLENDEVWKYKMDLLNKNNIAVWRFHDYSHSIVPDPIVMGVLNKLGWSKYYDEKNPRIVNIPVMKLGDIVSLAKEKLSIAHLRMIGDLNQSCSRVGLMPGAAGGRRQMQLIQNNSPDVLLCGESPEWETIEYIRDAQGAGIKKSLIVLGHSVSEEPGMELLVDWIQSKTPGIKVAHIASLDPFTWK